VLRAVLLAEGVVEQQAGFPGLFHEDRLGPQRRNEEKSG
jgi:hypothetical protein